MHGIVIEQYASGTVIAHIDPHYDSTNLNTIPGTSHGELKVLYSGPLLFAAEGGNDWDRAECEKVSVTLLPLLDKVIEGFERPFRDVCGILITIGVRRGLEIAAREAAKSTV